ncbi:AraC family transcriptional regulator [Paenibacillus cisolokensis]|uniref:helix-turn-helix domain-containing protein n=1 Tax=Paenibacillus cisolokensis TaxID=1658519 RepID=UPI003D2A0336
MAEPYFYRVASNPVSIDYGELNVLFAGESQTRPGHRIGPRVYDFYLMHHVLSGKGSFQCGDDVYTIEAGQTFLIEPERLVRYAADDDEPWHYRWVAFAGERAAALPASAGLSAARPIADTGGNRRVPVLYRRILETFRNAGAFAHLRAAGYLHLLFAEYGEARKNGRETLRQGKESERLTQQIIHYLSTQYAEPVTIESMAESLGYNRAYLSRLFKAHTGMTPMSFLLRLRIDKARQLLRDRSELTIEQVASSAGFRDPLYFSKQFRRVYGQSPTAYRDSLREDDV